MSGQIVRLEPDPHAAVQKLLPWYLTDRLDPTERTEVEEHLAGCAECRQELEVERAWRLLQPADGAQVDVEQGWAAMRARLGGEGEAARDARRARFPWLTARPDRAAWALPAALSAALLVALGLNMRPAPRGDYHALGAAPPDSATAVVRFRADATEAQIRAGLAACQARLVDGPTATDAYVLRLPREHYTEALDRLRRQPGVALVEALEIAPPP